MAVAVPGTFDQLKVSVRFSTAEAGLTESSTFTGGSTSAKELPMRISS